MSIFYPAQFEEEHEECFDAGFYRYDSIGFTVTFRDVPEANTQGDSFASSICMANDALKTAMEFYSERGEDYPTPSAPLSGEVMIELKHV